jgi:hypothetical protein
MKTMMLPPLRVTPKLRKAIESVLEEGETVSSFMLDAVTKQMDIRRQQKEFVARALRRSRETARTRQYVSGEVVFDRLRNVLSQARRRQS